MLNNELFYAGVQAQNKTSNYKTRSSINFEVFSFGFNYFPLSNRFLGLWLWNLFLLWPFNRKLVSLDYFAYKHFTTYVCFVEVLRRVVKNVLVSSKAGKKHDNANELIEKQKMIGDNISKLLVNCKIFFQPWVKTLTLL